MNFDDTLSLNRAIDDALIATGHGTNPQIIVWLQNHRAEVLAANHELIEGEGLNSLIRKYRKRKSLRGAVDDEAAARNLCFDFGIGFRPFPAEISLPRDIENPLGYEAEWRELEEATINDLDDHVVLLRATIDATAERIDDILELRQAAARVVPERTDIPIRELRRILRERMKGNAAD